MKLANIFGMYIGCNVMIFEVEGEEEEGISN